MKYLPLLGLLLSCAGLAAEKGAPHAVDLGNLEVNGEVRKPTLSYVDSARSAEEWVNKSVRTNLKSIEARLTRPATVTEVEENFRRLR